jgi:hypothetical protein
VKVIYIAGPFRAPNAWEVEKNIRRAEELAFEVNSLGGCIALCPHTNTRFFNGTLTDEFWLEGTKELLRRCDAAMFTDNWSCSFGARAELVLARSRKTPCFSSLRDLRAWLGGVWMPSRDFPNVETAPIAHEIALQHQLNTLDIIQ